jgi:hypothetical protein
LEPVTSLCHEWHLKPGFETLKSTALHHSAWTSGGNQAEDVAKMSSTLSRISKGKPEGKKYVNTKDHRKLLKLENIQQIHSPKNPRPLQLEPQTQPLVLPLPFAGPPQSVGELFYPHSVAGSSMVVQSVNSRKRNRGRVSVMKMLFNKLASLRQKNHTLAGGIERSCAQLFVASTLQHLSKFNRSCCYQRQSHGTV